jgi:exosortase A
MSAVAGSAEAPPVSPWGGLRASVPPLLLGLVALGMVFWREVVAAVEVWDASTAYNHCFLVIPIAAWMAWERRASIAYMQARPDMRVVILALPFTLAWFVADRIGVMEGRQLAMIGVLEVVFLAVLGWDLFRKLSAPLLYLIFLVPFGAFLTPWLQDLTAWFTVVGLNTLGILHYTDGLVIEIQGGTFVIAEACAGLRFLIASIAFGTLYACTIYRSPLRRAAFIVVSIVVPIIANGFRALGIVAAGYWLGSAEAAAADHVIYGWVFFSFVTLLLILIGLPFRQDREAEAMPVAPSTLPPAPSGQPAWRVAVVTAMLAAVGPGMAAALDRSAAQYVADGNSKPLALGGDCRNVTPIARRRAVTAEVREALCGSGHVRVTVAVFAPRANPSQIVAAQRLLSGEDGADEVDVSNLTSEQPDGPVWRVVETRKPDGLFVVAMWLDGKPGGFGLRARIAQAQASLAGASAAPVLVVLAPATPVEMLSATERTQLRLGMAAFLRQRRDLPGRFSELSTLAAR